MDINNRKTGDLGENIAEEYLRNLGYIILERNFRTKIGEIDLVGKDGDYIVFIEVKTRRGILYGSPCESVTKLKQKRISRTAELYIMKKKIYRFNFRFDVIEIMLSCNDTNHSIRLIKNAF